MNVILCWNRYIVSDDACHFKVRVWTVEALSSGATDENCQHSVLETVQYPCTDSAASFHPFLVANFSERWLFLQLTSLPSIGSSFLAIMYVFLQVRSHVAASSSARPCSRTLGKILLSFEELEETVQFPVSVEKLKPSVGDGVRGFLAIFDPCKSVGCKICELFLGP